MDTLYAITLIVALAAAIIAILASLLPMVGAGAHLQPDARIRKALLSHRMAYGVLALGVLSLTASVVVHSRWGHGPGTVAPMSFDRLLSQHQAFTVIAAMLLLSLILALVRKAARRKGLVRPAQRGR